MIIRSDEGRLRIVLQTDHARLAAQFAGAWGGGPFRAPEPLEPVCLAATIHDDGWLAWEERPAISPETGRPYDFMNLPTPQHLDIYERCVALTMREHLYSALLVSLHGTGLYRQRYGHMSHLTFKPVYPAFQPAADRYLADQDALQTSLLADLQPDKTALWTHYRWLQCWDLLSLVLGLFDPKEKRALSLGVMPHYPGGPEVEIVVRGAGVGVFQVSPWPFLTESLTVALPVRYVPDRAYASDAEFRAVFAQAPQEELTLSVAPGP